ncbi:MAG: hypothetical protein QOD61_584 [Solirubrobacteraceae bacterium]|nr:hypothetical protein [Solirubrobacteraceae bacterium]
MRRFWFTFEPSQDLPPAVAYGCGVTTFNYDDAVALLQARVFTDHPMPPPRSVTEDVDVSELDPGHIRPNMGDPAVRGVWFPTGYE